MNKLGDQGCEACRADAPTVTAEEQDAMMMELPAWEVIDEQGVSQLQRVFRFRNFAEALEYTSRVGELAEAEGHHPAILLEYGRVTVRWWTHKIQGLHRNDFIMAARTDVLYDS